MRLEAKVDVLALSVLGLCLVLASVGVLLLTPSGEQSKLFFRKCLNNPANYASCQ